MRELRHDVWHSIRSDLAAGRPWLDRAVVLTFAVLTGLVVVGFTLLAEAAGKGFASIRQIGAIGHWLPLLWSPALAVLLLWWTRRHAWGAQGSGIPQVLAVLNEQPFAADSSRLVSLRLSLQKIVLVSGGLLAGLSIGREGPTVQVGAGVMQHAHRWVSPRSGIDSHDLIVAGAAAGIAAAFNTPLGGVVFALEQLSRRRSLSQSGLMIISIVLAGLVAVSAFGNASYFGEIKVQALSWSLLFPGLLIGTVTGLCGGLFSRLIVLSTKGTPDRLSRWRAQYPLRFAAGCAFAVALIGIVDGGASTGAGYAPTRALLEGRSELPAAPMLLSSCARRNR